MLDRHAYQNAVRARLLAAYEGGAIMANIAVAMNPPATAAELYRFKRGEPWGVTRLARLVAVLDQLDQAAPTSSPPPPPAVEVPEGRPTDRAPPPDHEGQADDSQPAGPAPQPGPASQAREGWPPVGTIGRAIVELLAQQGPTDTAALAAALEGDEPNLRAMCGQLARRGLLRRLDGRVFALAV